RSMQHKAGECASKMEAQDVALGQLQALQNKNIVVAADADLHKLDADVRIAQQKLNALRLVLSDDQAKLAKMEQELEELLEEKAAVAEFNKVSDWLDAAKPEVRKIVSQIVEGFERLREIATTITRRSSADEVGP